MFTLSRDGTKFFLYNPSTGMEVPVLLDLESKILNIKMPSVYELEDDYASYEDIDDIKRNVNDVDKKRIEYARRFSQECTKLFRVQILSGKITISQLRELVHTSRNEIVALLEKLGVESSGVKLATPRSRPQTEGRYAEAAYETAQDAYIDPEPVAVVLTPPRTLAGTLTAPARFGLAKVSRAKSFNED